MINFFEKNLKIKWILLFSMMIGYTTVWNSEVASNEASTPLTQEKIVSDTYVRSSKLKSYSSNTQPAESVLERQMDQGIESVDIKQEMIRMFGTLAALVVILFIGAKLLKKLMNKRVQLVNNTSGIKVLERRSLAPKSNVYLLEVAGKGFLVGETPSGLTNLGHINIELIEDETTPLPIREKKEKASFKNIFRKVKKENATGIS